MFGRKKQRTGGGAYPAGYGHANDRTHSVQCGHCNDAVIADDLTYDEAREKAEEHNRQH